MAKRAGVVSVDVDPNLSKVGSTLDGFFRNLKPFGLSVDLKDNKFASAIEAQSAQSRRALDSITTTKAQGEIRALGSVGDQQLTRLSSLSKQSAGSLVAFGGAGVLGGQRLLASLKPATDAASALNETVSFSQQVFGASADEISKFAETADQKLGLSKKAAIDGANTFATFGKAAGKSSQELVGFSTALLGLAADLASAKDTTLDDSITAIGAALRGENEQIRRYGVLLDDQVTRQEAVALGITKTTQQALTPQQRVLAVNSLLFKRTSDAQGDFARTADSAANSARRFNAAQENTRAEEGKGLVGLLGAANNAGSFLLNTLGKIPGATAAIGTGTFALGSAAVIGGGVSALAGGVKAFNELRAARAAALATSGAEIATNTGLATSQTAVATTAGAIVGAEGAAAGAIEAEGVAAGTATTSNTALATSQEAVGKSAAGNAGKFGSFAKGLGAAAVAYGAFSLAINKNNEGFQESIDALTVGADQIAKAFAGAGDQAGATALKANVTEIARILTGLDTTGPQSAVDRVKDFFGAFDAADETENRVARMEAQLKVLEGTISSLPAAQAHQLYDDLRTALIGLGVSSEDADAKLASLKKALDARDATDKLAGGIDQGTAALDRFGFAIDSTKSKWEQYADSLSQAISPIQSAIDAQQAFADGQQAVADAQKRLDDILAGRSEALDSAAKSLKDAKADLNKAISETGPGSDAAQSALESLHQALKALHDAQVEAGKAPREGDFFEDKRAAISDAQARVDKARRDLDKINRGESDQVVSARDRVTDAQKRYNDELSKTGPHSKAAADAQKDLETAQRRLPGLWLAVETAAAKVRDEYEKHPEAIKATIEWIDKAAAAGQIPIAVAKKWKEELLKVLAVAEEINTTVTAAVGTVPGAQPGDPNGVPHGRGHTAGGGPNKAAGHPAEGYKTIPESRAELYGLPDNPVDGKLYGAPSSLLRPFDKINYRYDAKRHEFVPWTFADGGIMDRDKVQRFGSFPTEPGIVPTTGRGLSKVVAFESAAGPWEGYIPGGLDKRAKAVAVTREIAHRFGYELHDRNLQRVGATERAYANGGFWGTSTQAQPETTSSVTVKPVVDVSLGDLVNEVRSLRGELITTIRDVMMASGASPERLAPILRQIAANTSRPAAEASGPAMTDARRAQAGFAR